MIGTLDAPLARTGDPLGNLIADAYRAATGTDVALVNNGGIRADLPAGPTTWGALFEVEPFQNFLAKLRVSGAVLRQVLEHAVGGSDTGAHLSGLVVRVDPAAPAGARIVSATLADGRALLDTATYTLTVPDFVAAGGSGYAMLRGLPAENSGTVDLEALVAYVRWLPQPVRPPTDPRLVEVRR